MVVSRELVDGVGVGGGSDEYADEDNEEEGWSKACTAAILNRESDTKDALVNVSVEKKEDNDGIMMASLQDIYEFN